MAVEKGVEVAVEDLGSEGELVFIGRRRSHGKTITEDGSFCWVKLKREERMN